MASWRTVRHGSESCDGLAFGEGATAGPYLGHSEQLPELAAENLWEVVKMCKFASFVLTKDREFWSETGDSHTEIIKEHDLHEMGANGPNIVRVEISPTNKIKIWPSLKAWSYKVDQDLLPAWHDPKTTEKRTRAALLRRFKAGFKTVYASGCTALTELKADAAEYVYASGCTALTELKADAAEYVYARGCTALTELKADAAKTVYARGCTALTELKADAAKTVDASGCTALTELKADAAEYVDASGCNPKLVIKAKKGATIYR